MAWAKGQIWAHEGKCGSPGSQTIFPSRANLQQTCSPCEILPNLMPLLVIRKSYESTMTKICGISEISEIFFTFWNSLLVSLYRGLYKY